MEVGDGGLENSLQDWQEWKEDSDNLFNQSYMEEVWYQRSKEVVTQVSKNAEVKKPITFPQENIVGVRGFSVAEESGDLCCC